MSRPWLFYSIAYGVLSLSAVALVLARTGDEESAVMEVSFRTAVEDAGAIFELQRLKVMEEAAFIMVYGEFRSRLPEAVPHAYVSARFFDETGRELLHRRSPIVDGFAPNDEELAFSVGIPARQDVTLAEVELQDLDGNALPTVWGPGRLRERP